MRIVIFLLSLLLALPLSAQKLPRKVEKAGLATVSVLTYKDGVLKSSGTGVYVGGPYGRRSDAEGSRFPRDPPTLPRIQCTDRTNGTDRAPSRSAWIL